MIPSSSVERRPRIVLLIVVVAAVLAAVGIGLKLIGSPEAERARRLDERRLADLQTIARAVDVHWTRHQTLATSLGVLDEDGFNSADLRDPGTSEPYEYRVLDGRNYELCAVFEARTEEPRGRRDAAWTHGDGRQCFRLEAASVPKG
jgi:hypothetical protein